MKKMLSIALVFSVLSSVSAQVDFYSMNKKGSNYRFSTEKQIAGTGVKSQGSTGTCWSFSMQSFLESEIMRNKKSALDKNIDLAEMWTSRNAYFDKAVKYVRMQGKTSLSQGGEPHDVISMSKKYGIVPQEVYSGLSKGETKYDHSEIEGVLKAYCDALVKNLNEGKKLTPNWQKGIDGILDAYFGPKPKDFEIDGKKYTPMTYAANLGVDLNDYVEISSFTHHPYYTQFVIEIPDNWSSDAVYNVTLADLEAITDNAIANNYGIEWASDVSEKYFSFKNGLAILPEKNWADMTQPERDSSFLNPVKQMKDITPEFRQEAFDNQTTQDDHGMHIVGAAKDQLGTKYYIVKNSWGTEGNDMGGYFYCSKPYFLYKTTGIMVNKKAIPKDIAKKMGISI
jgi:bleomycin hydrolase